VVSSRARRCAAHWDRALIQVAGVPGITHFVDDNDFATAAKSTLREHS